MIFIIKNVTKQASGTGAVYYAEVWAQSQEPTRSGEIREVLMFAGTVAVDECVDHAMKAGKQ